MLSNLILGSAIFTSGVVFVQAPSSPAATARAGSQATASVQDWSRDVFTALAEARRRHVPVLVYAFDKF